MALLEAPQWWRRDRDIADRLVEILTQHARSGSRAFIYVNKIGPHYHYEYSYPPTAAIFRPTAPFPRWYQLIPVWDLSRMQKSYLDGLRWGVDEFFKYLLPKLEGLDVVILYTADHGQSMPTHREPATHGAAVYPPMQQADVPLALLTIGDSARSNLQPLLTEACKSIDRATQFSLFASALVVMGYQRDEANRAYSTSIFDAPSTERWFVSGDCIGRAPCHRNLFKLPVPAAGTRAETRD